MTLELHLAECNFYKYKIHDHILQTSFLCIILSIFSAHCSIYLLSHPFQILLFDSCRVHQWFKLGCRQVCANFMARLTSIPSTLNFNWFSFQVCMDRQFIWYRLVNRPKLACGQNPLKNPWPGKKEIQARAASGVGQNGSLADDPSVVEFSVWTTGWLWQHSKSSI
jgi:hypothetical protein